MKKLIIFFMFISKFANSQHLSLASLFTDNMVLQRESAAQIWGKAQSNQGISIETTWGIKAQTVSDAQGNWRTQLQTAGAGGPYQIRVRSGMEEIVLQNVLLGEVWLCSGQSNMEMPLRGWPPNDTIEHSAETIARSTNSHIRFFTVKHAYSLTPMQECTGTWHESMPETAAWFSATAYFFGARLYDELQIPIGLINASWGGTPAEAWTSAEALGAHPDFAKSIALRQDLIREERAVHDWIIEHQNIDVSKKNDSIKWKQLSLNDAFCSGEDIDDTDWRVLALPHGFENSEIGDFDGAIWFRRKIVVPAELCTGQVEIRLPALDDMDQVWINGQRVGATEMSGCWSKKRTYRFDGRLLNAGTNQLAIRIIDIDGGGGIWDAESPMELRSVDNQNIFVDLKGEYRYRIVAYYLNQHFYLFDARKNEWAQKPQQSETIGSSTPAALFNGMIQPIIPYTIAGTIWYQGETNVGRAEQYKTLFPALIEGWRTAWNQGNFPFYFVQICPWHYGNGKASDGAELRESQRLTQESVSNTGMVVTLDLGDFQNIHPPFKREVGRRLALLALAKNYGKKLVCSGPTPERLRVQNNCIIIHFSNVGSGLRLNNELETGFEISGDDGVFLPANAIISGNDVLVSNSQIVSPIKLRYAFKNNAVANLYNFEGLPASGFELNVVNNK